ncbi:MAG: class I SAM-dependent DNA methyltransferase, partial [Synechococcus sp. SB0668_bin_15]|nr:class I SAM-dependent DNA methyltransferase [Synechococcus sp. SB0668_bin_15]MYC49531.1 class I SAM-dependent DNA methyltransferase [Synechococcus sp. SB0662_bin_14]
MRLSWNEVRARAAAFTEEWRDAAYEKGETQSFYNDFFRVFGVKRRSVARYEAHVAKLDNRSGFIDLFWPGVLLVEQKSAGRDLGKAYEQAGEYFDALPERERPRHILVSDFQSFQLHDLEEGDTVAFTLADLPGHVEAFGFILGVQRRTFRDQDPVNIAAAELVGLLHDQLAAAGHGGHDLERFLVRIVFCLFADDTGIFEPRDIFVELIETRTSEDGADLGPWLAQMFQVLDTPERQRPATLDEDLARFPYINGDLFKGPLQLVSCNAAMRSALLDACRFDWSQVSPAIFGALFQSVMDPAQRRAQGAHYTTEKNILKVIEPLFMDDLRSEFTRLQARKTRRRATLHNFQTKLGSLTFFDPACGCGNFLIIAYRELRLLEIEVLKALHPRDRDGRRQLEGWAGDLSQLNVDQFYGIELGEFPARIAETALWMMDHIMNNRLSLEFGQTFVRIPLATSPNIVHGDALEMDWAGVLKPERCSYLFGNPPFVGQSYQSKEQREQMRKLTNPHGRTGSPLDYVGAWFLKAASYGTGAVRISFVATNSLTQGEQVALLWPHLFASGLEIAFAHRTFAWGSDARGKAHVHVVILGLDRQENVQPDKRLFSYPHLNGEPEETRHTALSPYLFDASRLADPHLVVTDSKRPLSPRPIMQRGVQPTDGGHFIFSDSERQDFLNQEPNAEKFFRPFIGAREHINGLSRWILFLEEAEPETLRTMPLSVERIRRVRAMRLASKKAATVRLADTPTRLEGRSIPAAPFLVIPETSSELREYVPIGYLRPPVIPSNALRVIESATLADFALLTSAIHMAWLRHIGGRLKSDYRYSIGLVYNTFPAPLPPKDASLSKLEPLAQAVLTARAAHPGATLADLYDPLTMPPNLRKAHQALDRVVDRFYRRSGFASERERVECLLMMYEGMQGV